MFGGIGVDRFAGSTVHGKISLPVTVEDRGFSSMTGPATGSLKIPVDTGSPWLADYPRETDIDRDELHVRSHTVPLTNTRRGGDTRRQDRGALSDTAIKLWYFRRDGL